MPRVGGFGRLGRCILPERNGVSPLQRRRENAREKRDRTDPLSPVWSLSTFDTGRQKSTKKTERSTISSSSASLGLSPSTISFAWLFNVSCLIREHAAEIDAVGHFTPIMNGTLNDEHPPLLIMALQRAISSDNVIAIYPHVDEKEMHICIRSRVNESKNRLAHAWYPLSRKTLINLDKWEVQPTASGKHSLPLKRYYLFSG